MGFGPPTGFPDSGEVDNLVVPSPTVPLPSEQFNNRTVIASTWIRDDEEPILALVMLLNTRPPYYSVASLKWVGTSWIIEHATEHPNINPATDEYANQGGDY